jgi:hypothetical protein
VIDIKGTFYAEVEGKTLRRLGIDEPAMQIRGRSGGLLVAVRPGYRRNHSGIRGMRDDVYTRKRTFAFDVMEDDTGMRITERLSWEG